MVVFEGYSGKRGWCPLNITDEHGTLNRLVTPETVGATKLRVIGNDGTIAECLWVGSNWLGVPEKDQSAQYIADSINAINIIFRTRS